MDSMQNRRRRRRRHRHQARERLLEEFPSKRSTGIKSLAEISKIIRYKEEGKGQWPTGF